MKLKSGVLVFHSAYAADVDIYEDGPDAPSYMVWRNAQVICNRCGGVHADMNTSCATRISYPGFSKGLGICFSSRTQETVVVVSNVDCIPIETMAAPTFPTF